MRPFTLSRSLRLFVARGSIAYSAVTQPLPLPVSHRGTPFVNEAVHSTFVPPKLMRADPSACALQPRSMVISRSCEVERPSARTMSVMSFSRSGMERRAQRASRAESGSVMTPVWTSCTSRTSRPMRRLASAVKSSAESPVAS